jgi:hypothetical protein
MLSEVIDDVQKLGFCVLASHVIKNAVTGALDGNMKELVNTRVVEYLCNRFQVSEDIGWIGHAYAEHAFFSFLLVSFL